ncbi:hypothetical protein VPH35_056079 [Triticum aestivum]|uniref:Uncharacterized protein n=1 Tax=Triticum aestivum TaxID=4565 RepID=A0A077S509_WHEAT|nr:unnamed protein product [Triticum aestivum]
MAGEALGDAASASSFLCSADELRFDAPARALAAEEALQPPGWLYFALPMSMLRRPLSGQEMAALTVKASSALTVASGTEFAFEYAGGTGTEFAFEYVGGTGTVFAGILGPEKHSESNGGYNTDKVVRFDNYWPYRYLKVVPKMPDRTRVEAKEIRLSDMPPVTLDDSNMHTKTDDTSEMNIPEDFDNRPSKKAKISESGVLESSPMSPTMSTSNPVSECFESIVPKSENQIDHDPLPSPSSSTLTPVLILHDVKEPDPNKGIKVDETYDYLPQGIYLFIMYTFVFYIFLKKFILCRLYIDRP